MDDQNLREKMHTELQEVIYKNTNPERIGEQLLQVKKHGNPCLYLTVITAALLVLVAGCGFSWSSPAFSYLSKSDTDINPLGRPISHFQESWIASLYCLGAAIGPLFAGKLADVLGRKIPLILIALSQILSLILLACATNVWHFYITRFLYGVSAGSTFAVLPTYLAEISEVHNKGRIGCSMGIAFTLGVLYPFIIGPYLSLKLFTLSCSVPSILFLILYRFLIPESPIYLVSRGKIDKARKAFTKLRSNDPVIAQKELLLVQQSIQNEHQQSEREDKSIFADRGVKKAFIISIGLLMSQQLSGVSAVVAFLEPIFEASNSSLSTYVSTILVGIIQVLGTVLAASLVEKLGRKILLLTSSILSSGAIILLGLYFYIKDNQVFDAGNLFWLPITSLIIYITGFNMGLGALPWTVTSEIFPSYVHSVASSVGSFCCFITSFGVTLCFPLLVTSIGMAKCFWLFGALLVLITVFICALVPETKGKTAAELQMILRGE